MLDASRRSKVVRILAIAVLPLLLASCGGSSGGGGDPTADWTVFVYGHADHNLTSGLLWNIGEMRKARMSGNVNVLVAADYCAATGYCASLKDPLKDPVNGQELKAGTQYMRIKGNDTVPELVTLTPQEYDGTSEQNFDDPEVLKKWVQVTFARYPAKHYAVILWDHGGSWDRGFGGDRQNDSEKDPKLMLAATMADAIARGIAAAGLGARKLDFLALDTCLLATNEVMWDFRNLATVFIANAEIDTGLGWNYKTSLEALSQSPGDVRAFARAEVAAWQALHLDETINRAALTDKMLSAHAALDLDKLATFEQDMKALVDVMKSPTTTLRWGEVGARRALAFPQYGLDTPAFDSGYYDVGQFLTQLGQATSDPAVATAARKANTSLQAMIIASSMGTWRADAGQVGVHTALNLKYAWTATYRTSYQALEWDKAVGWSWVIDKLASTDPGTLPEFEVTKSVTAPSVTVGLTVPAAATYASSAQLIVISPAAAPDAYYQRGTFWNDQVQGGGSYSQVWPRNVPVLLDKDGNASPVNVEPFLYQSAVLERIAGRILDLKGVKMYDAYGIVDGATGELFELEVDSGGLWDVSDAASYAGNIFLPQLGVLGDDKALPKAGEPLVLPAEGQPRLTVEYRPAPAGTRLAYVVWDVWGNSRGAIIDGLDLP